MFYPAGMREAQAQATNYTFRELPVKRKTAESSKLKAIPEEHQFSAEAAYADSIFRDALGDREGSILALQRALEAMPTYAPAILSMGSVLYQRRKDRRRPRVVPVPVIVAEEHNRHLPDH
jgi:hypothetical protein